MTPSYALRGRPRLFLANVTTTARTFVGHLTGGPLLSLPALPSSVSLSAAAAAAAAAAVAIVLAADDGSRPPAARSEAAAPAPAAPPPLVSMTDLIGDMTHLTCTTGTVAVRGGLHVRYWRYEHPDAPLGAGRAPLVALHGGPRCVAACPRAVSACRLGVVTERAQARERCLGVACRRNASPPPLIGGGGGAGRRRPAARSFTHNYILPLKLLAHLGWPVIFYDQCGCGASSVVAEPARDAPWLLTIPCASQAANRACACARARVCVRVCVCE